VLPQPTPPLLSPAGDRPEADAARLGEAEVWQLLGRADLIVRGVLTDQDPDARRRWRERAGAWPQDVNRAWVAQPGSR
jgi:hypothetical protein